MLKNTIAILVAISIVAVGGLIIGVQNLNDVNATNTSQKMSDEKKLDAIKSAAMAPDFPIMDIISTPPRSVDEAKQMTNSKFVPPTHLPVGYQVQIIEVDPDGQTATILASPNEITEKTSYYDFFWKDKGILIYYHQNYPGFEWSKDSASYSETNNAQPATVGGKRAVVADQRVGKNITGEDIPLLAELLLDHGDRWTVEVRADLPAGELVKIAESIR